MLSDITVSNETELKAAIEEAQAGTTIVMTDGVWQDIEIKFSGEGTDDRPITLRAETPGKVFLEGQSSLHLGGTYLVVEGLYFRNGYSPQGGVIRYQIGDDQTAFNSRVSNCVIEGFTRPNRWERDTWIGFYGQHNQLDHCYLAGKSNGGATLMVYLKGRQHFNNHHQIVNNYFGPRPRKGGPSAETMRLGGSETSMNPGYTNVSNNYFEACNGEVEIISDKSNFNSFTNNIFYKSEGSLVMRHSDFTRVSGNMFIGDEDSDFYGGIRVINSGHWITNNYFYRIRGQEFRSPLAIMNGIPKSSLNRYKQVADAVVAYNTWVDCRSPIQIGVGQNKASADVLPKSEIRSAPPIRTIIADNVIYNNQTDLHPIVNHDDMSGVTFERNVIDNGGEDYTQYDVLFNDRVKVKQINDWLYVPIESTSGALDSIYSGFGFKEIQTDLFGSSRKRQNRIGAIVDASAAESFLINTKNYGPSWYNPKKELAKPEIHKASRENLIESIEQAKPGDIIELTDVSYQLDQSIQVDKPITLRSAEGNRAKIVYTGDNGTPAFRMNPKGSLNVNNISLNGSADQLAFAPLDIDMSSAYKLFLDDCIVDGFDYVLRASKGSFADSVKILNSTIQNCQNGIVLAADERGNYNAEMVTISGSTFQNIGQNVIHFYRGGYDESTIGGVLTLMDNTFTNCGRQEQSGILLKTRGIINVDLNGNTFKNNPVQSVAVLWGAKNNKHSDNVLINSGKIVVQEQQKLELLY